MLLRVVICFQISIFEPLKTARHRAMVQPVRLWFAFKLVSLNHWKQLFSRTLLWVDVVICFQISIFEPLKTAMRYYYYYYTQLWFAFKLVSLNHWKQLITRHPLIHLYIPLVVICFQISIFEPLKTAEAAVRHIPEALWFAFKLVSLNHWKQQNR